MWRSLPLLILFLLVLALAGLHIGSADAFQAATVDMLASPQAGFLIHQLPTHGYGAAALAAVGQLAEPLGVSIADAAKMTGESTWTVKMKLRQGIYRAKKSGRRTIIIFESVKAHWATLPDAKFLAPPERRAG